MKNKNTAFLIIKLQKGPLFEEILRELEEEEKEESDLEDEVSCEEEKIQEPIQAPIIISESTKVMVEDLHSFKGEYSPEIVKAITLTMPKAPRSEETVKKEKEIFSSYE